MRQYFLGVFTTLAVLVIGSIVYLRFGFAEVRGDVPPSKIETYVMRASVHASVQRHAPELQNPVQPTDENLIAGGKQYLGECAGCHGTPGKETKHPDVLNPAAPQFPKVGTEYTEAQVFWVSKHGICRTGMFANGMWDSDQELWTMAAYIKRLNALPQRVKDELAKPKSGT
jgi:thiosulfate dehydrogenase